MPAQTTDPFTTAVLVGFIVSLLTVIYRELRGQLADRDKRIEKLEGEVEKMATRSSSLVTSTERMLNYFLDRESSSSRSESPSSSEGRHSP